MLCFAGQARVATSDRVAQATADLRAEAADAGMSVEEFVNAAGFWQEEPPAEPAGDPFRSPCTPNRITGNRRAARESQPLACTVVTACGALVRIHAQVSSCMPVQIKQSSTQLEILPLWPTQLHSWQHCAGFLISNVHCTGQ